MQAQDAVRCFAEQLVKNQKAGRRVVSVHGGGLEIDRMLRALNIESRKIDGLRVTDDATMEVVQMVLAGKVGKEIVAAIQACGGQAAGICGVDGGLFTCRRKRVGAGDLGWVGEVARVNLRLLNALLGADCLPVVASIGLGDDGRIYNINADEAACSLATALRADAVVFLTDVPGVMRRYPDPGSVIGELRIEQAKTLLEEGVLDRGMIPKIEASIAAVAGGAGSAWIIDGRQAQSLTALLRGELETGTRITAA